MNDVNGSQYCFLLLFEHFILATRVQIVDRPWRFLKYKTGDLFQRGSGVVKRIGEYIRLRKECSIYLGQLNLDICVCFRFIL